MFRARPVLLDPEAPQEPCRCTIKKVRSLEGRSVFGGPGFVAGSG